MRRNDGKTMHDVVYANVVENNEKYRDSRTSTGTNNSTVGHSTTDGNTQAKVNVNVISSKQPDTSLLAIGSMKHYGLATAYECPTVLLFVPVLVLESLYFSLFSTTFAYTTSCMVLPSFLLISGPTGMFSWW